MDWITTQAAAVKLGVSVIRVRQFIQEGRLAATKIGRDWLVSAEAVSTFQKRKPGRPKVQGQQAGGKRAAGAAVKGRKRPGK